MQIRLFRTTQDKDHLSKSYGNELLIEGTLREACNIVDPVIEFKYDPDILTKNYAYIADFGRFYYLGAPTVTGKTIRVKMHCDALMSHKAGILASPAHVVRSQGGDRFIKDSRATQTERIQWSAQDLGQAFTPGSAYILIKGATG